MPFSPRGVRGFVVRDSSLANWDQKVPYFEIPGVGPSGRNALSSTWDVAPILARELGVAVNWPELKSFNEMPGKERYQVGRWAKDLRPYQKQAALHIAQRSWSFLVLPPRTGKSPPSLAASMLVDSRKTLILCPSIARLGWATEVWDWCNASALVLDGRAGAEAFWYEPEATRRHWIRNDKKKRNGPREWTNALNDAFERAEYIICPYDILISQVNVDAAGRQHEMAHLQGWSERLACLDIDFAICDEIQLLRGRLEKSGREGLSRRSRTDKALARVPQVVGLTGTPIVAYPRDLWGQMDVLSKGAAASPPKRTPFTFEKRYAGAEHVDVEVGSDNGRAVTRSVWQSKGSSNEAELRERLSICAFIKTRAEILPDMPPITMQTVRVEGVPDESIVEVLRSKGSIDSKKKRLRLAALGPKLEVCIANVLQEVCAGEKTVIGCFHPDSAEVIHDALVSAMKRRDMGAQVKRVNAKTWLAHGGISADARSKMAVKFRTHTGAAVMVATVNSMPLAIRLDPAQSVHFLEYPETSTDYEQFGNRPNLPGVTRGLVWINYLLNDSIDEHIERTMLAKARTIANIIPSDDVRGLLSASEQPQLTGDALWASLLEGVDLDDIDLED